MPSSTKHHHPDGRWPLCAEPTEGVARLRRSQSGLGSECLAPHHEVAPVGVTKNKPCVRTTLCSRRFARAYIAHFFSHGRQFIIVRFGARELLIQQLATFHQGVEFSLARWRLSPDRAFEVVPIPVGVIMLAQRLSAVELHIAHPAKVTIMPSWHQHGCDFAIRCWQTGGSVLFPLRDLVADNVANVCDAIEIMTFQRQQWHGTRLRLLHVDRRRSARAVGCGVNHVSYCVRVAVNTKNCTSRPRPIRQHRLADAKHAGTGRLYASDFAVCPEEAE